MKISNTLSLLFVAHVMIVKTGKGDNSNQLIAKGDFDEEERLLFDYDHRSLLACPLPTTYFYKSDISIVSESPLSCSSTELTQFGADLQSWYDGVISEIPSLSMSLSTSVCARPRTTRRSLKVLPESNIEAPIDASYENYDRRELLLAPKSYTYSGTGTCRLCPVDNTDKRMLLSVEAEQGHRKLANDYTYTTFGFEKTSTGTVLNDGDYVRYEWMAQYGMEVRVEDPRGGYAPDKKARIFDSTNPVADKDFGTPNQKCPGGGPGIGSGGEPGKPGENCIAQKNLLIVQLRNMAEVNGNGNGGFIKFAFTAVTRIGHIAVIDMKYDQGSVTIEDRNNNKYNILFNGTGLNGVQIVPISQHVRSLQLNMYGSGAVVEIGIFSPSTSGEAISPRMRSYIKDKAPFQEIIPVLEYDLSYYLRSKLSDKYRTISSSCLYNKWFEIDVKVVQMPRNTTLSC